MRSGLPNGLKSSNNASVLQWLSGNSETLSLVPSGGIASFVGSSLTDSESCIDALSCWTEEGTLVFWTVAYAFRAVRSLEAQSNKHG